MFYTHKLLKQKNLLLGRIVDCCQGNESTDMLSILLKDHMIPVNVNTFCKTKSI